ncbi:MAG TPA: hypothetical protein VGM79_20735 [Streptosporangiaceae bacterium]|jgi:hypothetical protein
MTATLRVTRDANVPFELRRGRFDILADGAAVGSIENHETVEAPLEPGHHTLRLSKGRYSSRTRSFDLADGQVASFRCHGIRIWPMYLASAVVPSLAIALRPE